jgi:hypothetical protein
MGLARVRWQCLGADINCAAWSLGGQVRWDGADRGNRNQRLEGEFHIKIAGSPGGLYKPHVQLEVGATAARARPFAVSLKGSGHTPRRGFV